MQPLLIVIHMLAALCVIVLVLMQHGKGADVGAAFGSGASNTMFGSVGVTPFLVKLTAILAAVFFSTSILISFLLSQSHSDQVLAPTSITRQAPKEQTDSSQIQSLPVPSSSDDAKEGSKK